MSENSSPGDMTIDRTGLETQVAHVLAGWGAGDEARVHQLVKECSRELSDEDFASFVERAATTGATWGRHEAHPLARAVSRAVMSEVVLPGSQLEGASHVEVARKRPAIFLGNHLSFVDVNVLDHLLAERSYGDVMARLTTLVGPKVYKLPIRRIASLCFATIKMPQSSSRASGEAVMPPREVARVARDIFRIAGECQERGEPILIFPEGTRSRTGRMQRLLPAVARYLSHPDAVVLPFGLVGCQKLVPLTEDHVHPSVLRARIGSPVEVSTLLERTGGRREKVMDVIGFLISDVLPPEYRGTYDGSDPVLAEARTLADELDS